MGRFGEGQMVKNDLDVMLMYENQTREYKFNNVYLWRQMVFCQYFKINEKYGEVHKLTGYIYSN